MTKDQDMTRKVILSACVFLLLFGSGMAQTTTNIPRVPDWAKDAVWYQIFTERFANGDTGNDPTPHDIDGAWPYKIPDGWQISPWTSDWYKLQPWEKATGRDFYWNAGVRRYGGDIQGIIDKLDYLHDLGITAIYLTPIFESPSSHKYDTRMYHHVDNNFGPDPAGDEKIWAAENPADPSTWKWTSADKLFLKLVKEVHKRGMKIILDGVFNHVGTSFWAFKDVVKNQQKSLFKDWFRIKRWDDPDTPENEFEYEGWAGVKDLPEIKKDSTGALAPGFGDHVHAIVRRWMDPNGDGDPSDGIDGWRLDVAEKVGLTFWRQFRSWVKEVNPNAYITGEIWWQNWPIDQMFNASPWLQGDAFDGVMNYRFARAIREFVADRKDQITAKAFADSITALRKDYHPDNLYVLQNLLDSHDVDRMTSQLVNPDLWYDHSGNPGQNKSYQVRKPNETERAKFRLIVGLQMTLPGAPMVYYGDEAGMWGGDDPDCRKPMVWPEKTYEVETADPLGRPRQPDSVVFDAGLFNWYKKLIGLRHHHEVLSRGSLEFFFFDDEENILGYKRELGREMIVVIANNGSTKKTVRAALPGGRTSENTLVNLLDGRKIAGTHGMYSIELQPYEVIILK